jgi:hypothetical protein
MLLRGPETRGSGTGKEDRLCEIQGISALTRSFSAQPAGIRLMTAGPEKTRDGSFSRGGAEGAEMFLEITERQHFWRLPSRVHSV